MHICNKTLYVNIYVPNAHIATWLYQTSDSESRPRKVGLMHTYSKKHGYRESP